MPKRMVIQRRRHHQLLIDTIRTRKAEPVESVCGGIVRIVPMVSLCVDTEMAPGGNASPIGEREVFHHASAHQDYYSIASCGEKSGSKWGVRWTSPNPNPLYLCVSRKKLSSLYSCPTEAFAHPPLATTKSTSSRSGCIYSGRSASSYKASEMA